MKRQPFGRPMTLAGISKRGRRQILRAVALGIRDRRREARALYFRAFTFRCLEDDILAFIADAEAKQRATVEHILATGELPK